MMGPFALPFCLPRIVFFFMLLLCGHFSSAAPSVVAEKIPVTDSTVSAGKDKLLALLLTAGLGMIGVHRLYLGTKPWVPFFYLLTVGGVFFILPIVDFFVIAFSKNLQPLRNQPGFLMWMNNKPPELPGVR